MLGEIIADFSGQLTGTKVLPPDGTNPMMEASLQGSGTLLGMAATTLGTYWQTIRSTGVLYGEGNVVITTNDGGVAIWKGFGVGTSTGGGFAASYAVAGAFQTNSPSLARLNSVATIAEYDVDESGNWTWRISEWKSKASGN